MKIQSVESILERCNHDGDCMIWQGAKHRQGYGYARCTGKMQTTMRLIGILTHGEIGDSRMYQFTHTCDNLLCCNPDHIVPILRPQVCKDAYKNPDRLVRSGKDGTRVTAEQIRLIREFEPSEHYGHVAKFCREIGITRQQYVRVKDRAAYKWIK